MILNVMNTYLPGKGLQSDFIDALVQKKVLGGQNHDDPGHFGMSLKGEQRPGKERPAAQVEKLRALV